MNIKNEKVSRKFRNYLANKKVNRKYNDFISNGGLKFIGRLSEDTKQERDYVSELKRMYVRCKNV